MRALPAPDVEELRIFAEFEPLPDPYWIGAQICHLLYSVNRGKGAPKLSIEDFIPRLRADRKQTPEEMYAAFHAATDHLGGQ